MLHQYGCESNEAKEFVLDTEKKIENLYNTLIDTNTLLIISADHGHKDIEKVYDILDMEDIEDCLILPPSLESRCTAFWVKEEKKTEFEQIFQERFGEEFILYTKEEFLKKNMFPCLSEVQVLNWELISVKTINLHFGNLHIVVYLQKKWKYRLLL